MGGPKRKVRGPPKKNFPALRAGNGPPTFNLLPTPLQVPLIQLGGLWSAVSSPSGVWGGAPAETEFGAFLP